ncbi:hypothetical protein J6590_014334 [Homalodisca vitripennis]|nr:hypothetical protein J6590_014334 [Homalodisca vitripennis]
MSVINDGRNADSSRYGRGQNVFFVPVLDLSSALKRLQAFSSLLNSVGLAVNARFIIMLLFITQAMSTVLSFPVRNRQHRREYLWPKIRPVATRRKGDYFVSIDMSLGQHLTFGVNTTDKVNVL